MIATFFIPGKVPSLANLRLHWAVKAKVIRNQRQTAFLVAKANKVLPWPGGPLEVSLTRRGERQLDSDNLASACKGFRDGIADALEIDDGAFGLIWNYHQEKSKRVSTGLFVQIKAISQNTGKNE